MCLIYLNSGTTRTEPFTAYKVYLVSEKKTLVAPWNPYRAGGTIAAAGEVVASVSNVVTISWCNSVTWRGLNDKHRGTSINCSGLHCFVSEADAWQYVNALGMRANKAVVAVQIDPADVLVEGTTPTYVDVGVGELPTVVTRKFTISEAEFQKAVKQCA